MISLQLSRKIEGELTKIAQVEQATEAEIIMRAIEQFLKGYQKKKLTPYELGKDLFGKYGSKKGNLSKDYKNILRKKLHEKHSH